MTKIDLKKKLKALYNPSVKTVSEVDVPPMNYIMIDGTGDPNNMNEFQPRVEVLMALSYALHFAAKNLQGLDYVVMPVEGLWWVDDLKTLDLTSSERSNWKWTLMVMQPDHVTPMMYEAAVENVERRKKPVLLSNCRFEGYNEGRAAQIMHIGPYSAEIPTIEKIHAYILDHNHQFTLKHHEIYIGDPRKTAPDRLKTVIRQPFKSSQ